MIALMVGPNTVFLELVRVVIRFQRRETRSIASFLLRIGTSVVLALD
jgi:hypothetical protein